MINWGTLKMDIFNRKQDMPLEDGDRGLHRGPLTMSISNRKQDIPSEGGDGGLHRGPLTMSTSNRKQDMPSDGVLQGVLLRWLSGTCSLGGNLKKCPDRGGLGVFWR